MADGNPTAKTSHQSVVRFVELEMVGLLAMFRLVLDVYGKYDYWLILANC